MMKKIIGDKIKEYRENFVPKMNQAKLCVVALGYPESESNAAQKKISKIEAGTIDITIDELLKITSVLHIPLGEIFNCAIQEQTTNHYDDPIHYDIDKILNSSDNDAINALKYGVKGVLSTMQTETEMLKIIKKMAEDIENIKCGGAEEKSATAAPDYKKKSHKGGE